jgi:Ras-related GTP-binding protein C/D
MFTHHLPQTPLSRIVAISSRAHAVNKEIRIEVFVHKVDGLTEDSKMSAQQDITQRANDDLAEQGLESLGRDSPICKNYS